MKPVPSSTLPLDGPSSLLRISRLSVSYASDSGPPAPALCDLDLQIAPGEVVGILGESGCGKSTLALSILGLLPETAVVEGAIRYQDQDLLSLDESELRTIRGAKISLINQEPRLSLSPVMPVGVQIAEVLYAHQRLNREARKQESEAILREVQLQDADRVYGAYPHQLSGGELHRVAIAQALVCRPDLVIADEPTRSLDLTIQAEILSLFRELTRKFGTALIFITHNPALLVGLADRVIVMYAGRIVEEGRVPDVFRRPLHPYTKGLLQLIPTSLRDDVLSPQKHLPTIPGGPPDLASLRPGCSFEPRCPQRTAICQSEFPDPLEPEEDHQVSCFNHGN